MVGDVSVRIVYHKDILFPDEAIVRIDVKISRRAKQWGVSLIAKKPKPRTDLILSKTSKGAAFTTDGEIFAGALRSLADKIDGAT